MGLLVMESLLIRCRNSFAPIQSEMQRLQTQRPYPDLRGRSQGHGPLHQHLVHPRIYHTTTPTAAWFRSKPTTDLSFKGICIRSSLMKAHFFLRQRLASHPFRTTHLLTL
ncbi:hypothetical protein FKM82_016940 [Ascaphus truei]